MADKQDIAQALDILDLCRRLVSIVHSASKNTEKELGLSSAQFFVLQKMSDGQARSVNDLAELTRTHQSSVSVVIKKLVSKNMLKSSPAKDDARKLSLRLTAKGKKVLDTWSTETIQDRLIHSIDQLSVNDAQELYRLLNLVVSQLQPTGQPAPLFLED